jgi:mRNA interferase MazF
MAIVCPITSRARPFPTSVVLPAGLPIGGEILVSHVRGIDVLPRPVRPMGVGVPMAVLADMRAKLAALTGVTS